MKEDSQYLENDLVIPLHKSLARTFGVPSALILQQIRYWMNNHRSSEQDLPESHRRHYHQDRWWIWNTYEDWKKEHFDFWSERTIQRHILKLQRRRVLLCGQFNRRAGDKTKWYTIDYDRMDWLVGLHTGKHQLYQLTPWCHFGTMVVPLWHDVMVTNWHVGSATLTRPLPKIYNKDKEKEKDSISKETQIWVEALDELQLQLPKETFDTWLRSASLLSSDGQTYVVGVHNIHAREWLDQRLSKVITRTLTRIAGEMVRVEFEVKA